jgi:D-tyrosyl-tRNA(Tyr) deacylase
VTRASVAVDGRVTGEIARGLLVLVGATHDDDDEAVRWLARKVSELRIFADDQGRMNRDVREAGGAVLVVPQFTLYGEARRGRRPDFLRAARPEQAAPLVEAFAQALEAQGLAVGRGVFGAHMEVALINDGPVTLMIESPIAAERS